jgi:hypothetical protein
MILCAQMLLILIGLNGFIDYENCRLKFKIHKLGLDIGVASSLISYDQIWLGYQSSG